jgi:hypothetical protein
LFATGVVDTATLLKLVAKFAAGVVDTGGKFATGVVDSGGRIATGVVDTSGQPLAANISENFRKNSKRPKWYSQGLGGN